MSAKLMEERLIACSNIFPMKSEFRWDGQLCKEDEVVSIFKTNLTLESTVEARILALHAYDLPCIIRYPVGCNDSYAKWVAEQVV